MTAALLCYVQRFAVIWRPVTELLALQQYELQAKKQQWNWLLDQIRLYSAPDDSGREA